MAGLIINHVPFGTSKPCRVDEVFRRGNAAALMLFPDGEDRPTLCLFDRASAEGVQKGDRGTMTFTQGGPMGGYWKFEKSPVLKGA